MFKNTEFITSVAAPAELLDLAGLPEFIFLGRSNVGKSSLLNSLVGTKNLAFTSSKPGKTTLVNYFKISDAGWLIDVPGYGYALRSKADRARFGALIEALLAKFTRGQIILLIDTKVGPTADDVAMRAFLAHFNLPVTIVLTKADKVPKTRLATFAKQALARLGTSDPHFVTSATTQAGIAPLKTYLSQFLT